MIQVETSIHIQQPAEKVFNYISDFEKNPEWQSGMVACRFTTDAPLRIGSTYDQEATFLGRKIISSFEVIEYIPNEMVKATTRSSSFPITFTRIVKPLENGCEVSAIIEGDASGFFRLAEPLMRGMVRRSIVKDYKKLKQLMEE